MSTDVSSAENEGGAPIRTARVPKYYRLKKHLLDMTETLPPGTPVPPERTLATEFDTSRTTVRQALQELVVEGRLERIQGKGTFVAKPKVSQALQLTSYTEDMRAQGLEPTSQLLDIGYITAEDTLAELLDISTGGRVLRIERLRLASRWRSRRPTCPPSASPR
jgi:GntR family transcriptional regulator